MKNLEKTIKEAISSKKCKIGTREVMGSIKGSKLIVLSNSLIDTNKSKILEDAKAAQVPTLQYDGNSVQLGRLCNKTFRISTISLKVGSDNEIQELLNEFGNKWYIWPIAVTLKKLFKSNFYKWLQNGKPNFKLTKQPNNRG